MFENIIPIVIPINGEDAIDEHTDLSDGRFWSVNTLKEHHKFLTKTEISLISDKYFEGYSLHWWH